MAILLVGVDDRLGPVLVRRLVEQGDEVRAIVTDDADLATQLKSNGAHVARGSPEDADLTERAAQSVRTVVVVAGAGSTGLVDLVKAVLAGATAAGVDRIVVCTDKPDGRIAAAARSADVDFIVMSTGGRARRILRRPVAVNDLAKAIDAADDLSGHPRLEIDLLEGASWRTLGLESPVRKASFTAGSETPDP